MTSLIPESIFTWVSLVGTQVPPRDPNPRPSQKRLASVAISPCCSAIS
jgi:hypothetical protein